MKGTIECVVNDMYEEEDIKFDSSSESAKKKAIFEAVKKMWLRRYPERNISRMSTSTVLLKPRQRGVYLASGNVDVHFKKGSWNDFEVIPYAIRLSSS